MMMRRQPIDTKRVALGFLVGLSLIFPSVQAVAQALRDPTLPPAELEIASTAQRDKSLGIEPGSMSVIVRNGQSYLAVGTRLYAPGQKLGMARIERIAETEVWLRLRGVLHKVPQFPGIERRAVTPIAAPQACASGSVQSSESDTHCVRNKP